MKKAVGVLVVALFALTLSVPALASVEFSGQVATTLQSLESEFLEESLEEEIGFGDALFNLQVHGKVAEGVTGFAEVHNNPQEFLAGDPEDFLSPPLFSFTFRDPNDVALREAYITFHDMFPHAYLKVGRVDLKYGTQYMDRSVNARVQDNSLIGNHLADFGGPETGIHTGGEFPLRAANLGIDWYAAVTNGTREASVNEGQSLAFTGSLGFDIFSAGYLKGSYHRVSHDEEEVDMNGFSQFGVGEGEAYLLTTEGGSSIGPGGTAQIPSTVAVFPNPEIRAWQVDGRYDIQNLNLELSGYVGNIDFSSDPIADEADYWNAQADWMFTPRTGLAGRYGEIDFDESTQTWERAQIGLRHQYRENVLAKLEYVDQQVEEEEGTISQFDGVIAELSVGF